MLQHLAWDGTQEPGAFQWEQNSGEGWLLMMRVGTPVEVQLEARYLLEENRAGETRRRREHG